MRDTLAKDVKEVKEHIEGLSSQMRAVSLSFNFLFTCSCVYLVYRLIIPRTLYKVSPGRYKTQVTRHR